VLWTVKQACREDRFIVRPLSNDDLIVACANQALYSLREGKTLWTSTLGASGGWWSWSDIMSDSSGSIYVGAEGAGVRYELTALDKSGSQIWTFPTGMMSVRPVGFDTQGRLYVSVEERIVSLSQ
jgi:outer membrane protein assembly factor BamB